MLRFLILLSTWFSLSYGCLACSYGDIKVLTHLDGDVNTRCTQRTYYEFGDGIYDCYYCGIRDGFA